MAEVIVQQQILLNLTSTEYRLMLKALGLLAGLKISNTAEERKEAHKLNQALLKQRRDMLKQQYEQAEGTLQKATPFDPASVGFPTVDVLLGKKEDERDLDGLSRLKELKSTVEEVGDPAGGFR